MSTKNQKNVFTFFRSQVPRVRVPSTKDSATPTDTNLTPTRTSSPNCPHHGVRQIRPMLSFSLAAIQDPTCRAIYGACSHPRGVHCKNLAG